MPPEEETGSAGPGLLSVRYGIPAVLIVVGLGFLLFAPDTIRLEAWAMFTGAGLSVLLPEGAVTPEWEEEQARGSRAKGGTP